MIMVDKAAYDAKHGKALKILATKQMLYSLPIALAQVKAGNTSENLLNEIRQIIYYLYWEKEIIKKVHNNIMNSIKLYSRMDAIFINSKSSKTKEVLKIEVLKVLKPS